ncbi:hypothetical protein P4U65_14840 [Bacillus pacificus]|nr:hypothetical protein [Bacillus pacificus]
MYNKKKILIIAKEFKKEISTRFEKISIIKLNETEQSICGEKVDRILAPKNMSNKEKKWFDECIMPLTLTNPREVLITYY